MKKTKEIILQILENKGSGQRYITIPKRESQFKVGDFVLISRVETR